MNLNWGNKLVFFLIVFMLFIISLITYMMNEKIDLVEKDYYEKGIHHQSEIDKYKSTSGLDHHFSFDTATKTISFISALGGNQKGILRFYRPSDETMDFTKEITLDTEGAFKYNAKELQKGFWRITFEWTTGNQPMASGYQFTIR